MTNRFLPLTDDCLKMGASANAAPQGTAGILPASKTMRAGCPRSFRAERALLRKAPEMLSEVRSFKVPLFQLSASICKNLVNLRLTLPQAGKPVPLSAFLKTAALLAAALLLSSSAYAAPLITAQPTGQIAFAGAQYAFFQVIETGATSYQWQVKVGGAGVPANVSGSKYTAAGSILRINGPDATLDGNTYGCVITGDSGSITSVFAPLKVFAAPVAGAPVVTLGNSTISANSTDDVSIQIAGLTAGQSVRIDRLVDLDGDQKPGPLEPLVQSFTITDGVQDVASPTIPYDQDVSTNGQVTTAFSLASSPDLGRAQGIHLIRVTSPTGAFLPITKTLTVQGNSYGQYIRGQVRDSASSPVVSSFVTAVQGASIIATVAVEVDGTFTLWAPPGTYSVVPVATGYTASMSSQPTATLISGVNSTGKNPILTLATATISGRVQDISGNPTLRGVQLSATSGSFFSLVTSDSDGNYIIPTVPGTWTIHASPASLSLLGYLEPVTPPQATTTSGNVTPLNLSFSSATSTPSYATWKATAGFSESDLTSAAISGETADPDGDGLTNLMEYALGGSPKVGDSATITPVVDSNGSQIQISFCCDDSRQDITYTVQSSTDLAPNSWTDIAQSTGGGAFSATAGTTVTDPGNGTGSRIVTVIATLPVGGKLFLRVKAFK